MKLGTVCSASEVQAAQTAVTNLIKFYQNVKARNHATNVHCRLLQDSSQGVI